MYSNVDSLHTRNLSMLSSHDHCVGLLLPVEVSGRVQMIFWSAKRPKATNSGIGSWLCGHLATLTHSRLVAECYSSPANLLINFCTNAVQACTVSSVSFRDSMGDTFHTEFWTTGWKFTFKFHISSHSGYRLAATTNQPIFTWAANWWVRGTGQSTCWAPNHWRVSTTCTSTPTTSSTTWWLRWRNRPLEQQHWS